MENVLLQYFGSGEDYVSLTHGKTYEAYQEIDSDGDLVYVITSDDGAEASYTVYPDSDGLSYRNWFTIVPPVNNKSMWIVVHTDQYYPSVLHFNTEEEAKAWVDKYTENFDEHENFYNFYITEVKQVIEGAKGFKEDLKKNDIEWTIDRGEGE